MTVREDEAAGQTAEYGGASGADALAEADRAAGADVLAEADHAAGADVLAEADHAADADVLARPVAHTRPAFHHVELWTHDLSIATAFDWLLERLGWTARHDPDWPAGRTWHHADGSYLVLEQSPDVTGDAHERTRPGLNHLALTIGDAASLADLRAEAPAHGWTELFSDLFPHAGGPDHTAVYLENAQGHEIEIVAPSR